MIFAVITDKASAALVKDLQQRGFGEHAHHLGQDEFKHCDGEPHAVIATIITAVVLRC